VKIFATRRIPEAGLRILRSAGDVEIGVEADDEAVPRERLLEGIRRADVLVSLLTERIDREALEAGRGLRGVANYAVGFNNVEVAAATELGIPVTNTPGVLTDTTADLAWALIMSVARNIVPADRYMRTGKYRIWGPSLFLGGDVSPGGEGRRKVLGIIGFGRIGQAVFRRSIGFDMRVLAYDPPLREVIEKTEGVEYAEMDQILEESDFITVHTDLNPSTRHLLSGPAFEKMKSTAYLINTARGPIVDQKALTRVLQERRIAGAGLDVLEKEPPDADDPILKLDNVIFAPHALCWTDQCFAGIGACDVRAVLELMQGKEPTGVVNKEVLGSPLWRKRLESFR
jgi:glyoxylate reductase